MLPRRIKIGSQTYKIKLGTDRALGENAADIDTDATLIRLRKSLVKSRRAECLIHECIHALLTGHEVREEETVALLLGEGISQIIRDNPHFIEYVQEALES